LTGLEEDVAGGQGPNWTDDGGDDDEGDVSWFSKRHVWNCIRFLMSNGSIVTLIISTNKIAIFATATMI
jgi:hypothetical protein